MRPATTSCRLTASSLKSFRTARKRSNRKSPTRLACRSGVIFAFASDLQFATRREHSVHAFGRRRRAKSSQSGRRLNFPDLSRNRLVSRISCFYNNNSSRVCPAYLLPEPSSTPQLQLDDISRRNQMSVSISMSSFLL